MEPRMAAMFCSTMVGRIYFSRFSLKRKIARGTNIIRDMSFVTSMEEKNTANTRKNARARAFFILPAKATSGRKTFSFLKPSSTVSIINSEAMVRQSMLCSVCSPGFEINSMEHTAAARATVSIISFLKNPYIFFNKTIRTTTPIPVCNARKRG